MIKSNKNNKKKKGFTLVELIAVIAIIGILAAILIPSIGGFITKAKKSKVIEQSRQFAVSVESVVAENKLATGTATPRPAAKADATIAYMLTVPSFQELVGGTAGTAPAITDVYPNLPGTMTYQQASDIAAGGDFEIDKDTGMFQS